MDRVCAVIVTYNRSKYLEKCIAGLERQSHKLDRIFVFDNHSTDDTVSFLKKNNFSVLNSQKLESKVYYENAENEGGAGGFAKAIQIAQNFNDVDYLWIMDDDVLPDDKCLEIMLIEMHQKNVQVAIPNRNDKDFHDRVTTDFDLTDYKKWWITMRKKEVPHPLTESSYFVKDMAFEGPLISLGVCREAGIPDSGYFLEFDDTDYAMRLQKYSKILYVTNAKLKRQIPQKLGNEIPQAYTWRQYYNIRNTIIFDKKYGQNWKVRNLSPILLILHHIVVSKREKHLGDNLPIILKAYFDGIRKKMGKQVKPNY